MEQNKWRLYGLAFVFSWLPYLVVAWGYMKLADDLWGDFWTALLWLLVARTFFSIIEILGGIAAWRVYGRRALTQSYLELLRENDFPQRTNSYDDVLGYLSGIELDVDGVLSDQVKRAATEFRTALAIYRTTGLFAGLRHLAAAEAALEIYSPKSKAPDWGEEWDGATSEPDSAH